MPEAEEKEVDAREAEEIARRHVLATTGPVVYLVPEISGILYGAPERPEDVWIFIVDEGACRFGMFDGGVRYVCVSRKTGKIVCDGMTHG